MTEEEISRQEPEHSYYIPPQGAPMTNNPKSPERKPGNDWFSVVYMIVGLFVLIAAFQLYFVIQDLIRIWISDQFVPVFSAIYYLVVIIGGVWLFRDYVRRQ
jgi:hypothetical protein